MNNRSTFLLKYFGDRFILLKDEWLNNTIEFLYKNVRTASNLTDEKFANLVFEQWKCADFASSSFSVLGNHGIEPTTKKHTLQGPIVCQINSIIDIGSPFYAQYCQLSNTVKEDNSGFEKLFHEKTDDTDKKPCRMLKLTLSDGDSQIYAIEFQKCPQLSMYIKPGCKILIRPSTCLRKGTFLLNPSNFQILGGECLPLLNDQRPLDRYRKFLNKTEKRPEKPPTPAKKLESRPSTSKIQEPLPIPDDFEDIVEDSMDLPYPSPPGPSVTVSSLTSRLTTEFIEEVEKNEPMLRKSEQKNTPKPCGMLKSKKSMDKNAEELENRIEDGEDPINYPESKRTICVKIEDDDGIEVIELETPSPKKRKTSETRKITKEQKMALKKYKNLEILKIANCKRKMKFCCGSRKFKVMTLIDDVIEPLRVRDNLWTMKVSIKDETKENQEVYIDNNTLEQLIGFNCQQAIEIRKSSDMEKRKDGKRRLDALESQLQRLDLLFEIEFFNDATVLPVIRSMKTLAEELDAY